MLTPNASNSKLLSKDLLQTVGDFLESDSAQKMTETSKQWSKVKIYENIFSNECEVAVFRNVNTGEIMQESIKFPKLWEPLPEQGEFVSHLCRNDSAKWNDVFVWLVKYRVELIHKNKSQNEVFLKELMLAIAENVAVTFTDRYGYFPLMLAAAFDGTNSILALIKKGADVNQQDNSGRIALHFAAMYGNVNACAILLDKTANIDAADHGGNTPLMYAAYFGKKNAFKFLIEKGANQTLRDNRDNTASQLANFQQR